jgi:hypothetical protein
MKKASMLPRVTAVIVPCGVPMASASHGQKVCIPSYNGEVSTHCSTKTGKE